MVFFEMDCKDLIIQSVANSTESTGQPKCNLLQSLITSNQILNFPFFPVWGKKGQDNFKKWKKAFVSCNSFLAIIFA